MKPFVAVNEKRTHFGRAGEFFAMSELLLRGWNVAIPAVDVGDDVFVIDDNDKTTLRVQVKSRLIQRNDKTNLPEASFTISRAQLRTGFSTRLIYMFLVRESSTWRFFVIPQLQLSRLHNRYVEAPKSGPGRPPKRHQEATTDSLTFTISLEGEPRVWGASLADFESTWPDELPEIRNGPGSVGGGSES
ncbi:MAG: group I intron-associated PD-(D/E)XK endonuclease [Enhygromyxa sp.]